MSDQNFPDDRTPDARRDAEQPADHARTSPVSAPDAAAAPRADATIPPRPPLPGAPADSGSAFHTQPTQPYGQHAPQGGAPAFGQSFTATAAPEQHDRSRVGGGKIAAILVAAALVGGAAGVGGAAAVGSSFVAAPASQSAGPSSITVNNPDSVNATTAIATKVLPSVVTISASSGTSGGTGSGVILSDDGYVLTNTHVVTLDGATGDPKLSVTTSDGRVYAATIVGTDPTYDLAVIKLTDASGLTPIEFADSSKLNVGDQTVAVGAPLGLSNTVTTGIVSALNRSIQIASSAAPDSEGGTPQDETPGGRTPFEFDFGQGQQTPSQPKSSIAISVIQTDAAINPGNSGGALVDGKGRLIGINVAIASAGGTSTEAGSIGVGFAIPSTVAERVANEIIDDGSATHGLLGATVGDAAAAPGATRAGALINEVTSGGAAASAGLRNGDIVTKFNGVAITDQVDLTAQVRALAAGSKAELTYIRDGREQTANVTLGELQQ
ncbi:MULTISPECIES: S1C family serine protease [Microbacterium]|uniref:S1C family serine protease n=1 Tax=Microbacterium TaxID=33882 RepID=UPI000E752F67|nr:MULTISPECIES: trypsin-like peptidase domain-containing protein [Microbacterium]RKE63331.1 putative serine protease PepD [Microbacterium sp. AG238]WJM17025.1 trypsin-like peptidase domain-containing protein [Microbacterium arborescens]